MLPEGGWAPRDVGGIGAIALDMQELYHNARLPQAFEVFHGKRDLVSYGIRK